MPKKLYIVYRVIFDSKSIETITVENGIRWSQEGISFMNIDNSDNLGVLFVFTNKRKARKFAGKDTEIMEVFTK